MSDKKGKQTNQKFQNLNESLEGISNLRPKYSQTEDDVQKSLAGLSSLRPNIPRRTTSNPKPQSQTSGNNRSDSSQNSSETSGKKE